MLPVEAEIDQTESVATAEHLWKRFDPAVLAVTDVNLRLRRGRVHGLLGRNGAGKSTLLGLLAGHLLPTTGTVRCFGGDPVREREVSSRIAAVSINAFAPTDRVRTLLRTASVLMPGWDGAFADRLITDFELPTDRKVKELSQGQQSALRIVISLASRAPLLLLDEPTLGLDSLARERFTKALIETINETAPTVVLSTHLIDEVADLIEHVFVMGHGRLALDESVDTVHAKAFELSGPTDAVEQLAAGRSVLYREAMGGTERVGVYGDADEAWHQLLSFLPVTVRPMGFQRFVTELPQAQEAYVRAEGSR